MMTNDETEAFYKEFLAVVNDMGGRMRMPYDTEANKALNHKRYELECRLSDTIAYWREAAVCISHPLPAGLWKSMVVPMIEFESEHSYINYECYYRG